MEGGKKRSRYNFDGDSPDFFKNYIKAFRILKTRLPWKVSVLGSASFISVNVPPSMGRFPEVAAGQGVKHPLLTTHVLVQSNSVGTPTKWNFDSSSNHLRAMGL